MILCPFWIKKVIYLHTMHLALGLPSHLSSLTIVLRIKTKKNRRSHNKVFRIKTSTCRDGTLKNLPNKTPQYFTPSLHFVPFCNYAHHKTLYMHITLFLSTPTKHTTQHWSLHSLPHKIQLISDMFSSKKVHNIHSQTCHTDPALLMYSTALPHKTYHICRMLRSNYIAATRKIPIPILFGWLLRVPSLHVFFLFRKVLLWL